MAFATLPYDVVSEIMQQLLNTFTIDDIYSALPTPNDIIDDVQPVWFEHRKLVTFAHVNSATWYCCRPTLYSHAHIRASETNSEGMDPILDKNLESFSRKVQGSTQLKECIRYVTSLSSVHHG